MYHLLATGKIVSDKELEENTLFVDKGYIVSDRLSIVKIKVVESALEAYKLIKKNDLIEYRYHDTETFDISKVVHIDEYGIMTRGYLHDDEEITKIYKQDIEGNYILAWGKKRDE